MSDVGHYPPNFVLAGGRRRGVVRELRGRGGSCILEDFGSGLRAEAWERVGRMVIFYFFRGDLVCF